MKRMIGGWAWVCLMALALTPAAMAGEKLVELDASGGTSTGQWACFISKGMAPNAPMGTIAAGVGTGDTLDTAFGMSIKAAKPTLGPVSAEVIEAARTSDKKPPATTTLVKVSADQYAKLKAIVDKWNAIKEHVDRPPDVVVNFVQEMLDALGMKRPYRSGLGGLNPVQYYGDIAIVNRKLGAAKS